mgnify:CR=1 FL=1
MSSFLLGKGYFLIYSIWHPIEEYGKQHSWKKMSLKTIDIDSNDWGNIIAFTNENDYNEFRRKNKM